MCRPSNHPRPTRSTLVVDPSKLADDLVESFEDARGLARGLCIPGGFKRCPHVLLDHLEIGVGTAHTPASLQSLDEHERSVSSAKKCALGRVPLALLKYRVLRLGSLVQLNTSLEQVGKLLSKMQDFLFGWLVRFFLLPLLLVVFSPNRCRRKKEEAERHEEPEA